VDSVDTGNASVVLRAPITLEGLNAIRNQVRQATVDAGMTPERADLLVLAVNEGMMNAILHGGGGGEVTLMRTARDGLIAVVEDVRGHHFDLPAHTPPQDQLGGRGLWLVKQICDRVAIRRGRRGTQLVLAFGLRSPV
jgi:anti-sigma regulatory factor (Ser/Thr protein kinase)